MREQTAVQMAKVFDERAKVYVKKVQGELYPSIHVLSRNVSLIDKLVRTGMGSVYVRPGGTRDWSWARRSDFRKYLPAIIGHIEDESLKEILKAIWHWSLASTSGQEKTKRALTVRILVRRRKDESRPNAGDAVDHV